MPIKKKKLIKYGTKATHLFDFGLAHQEAKCILPTVGFTVGFVRESGLKEFKEGW